MIYLKSGLYGLLLSSTTHGGVDASLRGAKHVQSAQRNERDLQTSSGSVSFPSAVLSLSSYITLTSSVRTKQSRNIYCGAWNNNNCRDPTTGVKTNVLTVDASETRPVRCCINTALSNNWKGCRTIANVYSDSFPGMTFDSAKDYCESNYEAHGGRLCDPAEMEDKCGTGSGLGYNKEHVWACTADGGTCEQGDAAACCGGYCNESNVCEVGYIFISRRRPFRKLHPALILNGYLLYPFRRLRPQTSQRKARRTSRAESPAFLRPTR